MILEINMNSARAQHSGWTMILGVFLMILGILTLSVQVFTTLVSVSFLGWMLILGGVLEFMYGFFSGSVGRAFLFFLGGIITFFVGVLIAANPALSAGTFTLIIGLFMVFTGIYKAFSSLVNRYPNWGWIFTSGIVSFLLGSMIFAQWPFSGLWVIGLFIGVELFISGFVLMVNAFKPAEYVDQRYKESAYISGAKGGSVKKEKNYEDYYKN